MSHQNKKFAIERMTRQIATRVAAVQGAIAGGTAPFPGSPLHDALKDEVLSWERQLAAFVKARRREASFARNVIGAGRPGYDQAQSARDLERNAAALAAIGLPLLREVVRLAQALNPDGPAHGSAGDKLQRDADAARKVLDGVANAIKRTVEGQKQIEFQLPRNVEQQFREVVVRPAGPPAPGAPGWTPPASMPADLFMIALWTFMVIKRRLADRRTD